MSTLKGGTTIYHYHHYHHHVAMYEGACHDKVIPFYDTKIKIEPRMK